jgi:class 3 adenylate cyclase
MADVFISYARSTLSHALAIARALREQGYSVWLDADLPTHRAYPRVIEEQLEAAHAVVVVWSADAVASDWVRSEANRGREAGKLAQVLVDDTPLPMPFDQIQCAPLSGWSGGGDDPGWRTTLATIGELTASRRGAAAAIPPMSGDGERRHVAAMVCDIIGASELAARLDPEDWHEIALAHRQAAAELIGRFGGHVSHHAGDGVVAYFGYPQAQEDAAERAILASLRIVEAMGELNHRLAGRADAPLSVGVGIDCGTVVISSGPGAEPEVFGEAPTMAAWLQAMAEPDSVVISETVRELAAGRFETIDLGPTTFKGVAEAQHVYRVDAHQPQGRRRHRRGGHGPLIGRDEELGLLLARWARASAGDGQVVMLVGEPGIGKTRLVEAVRAHCGADVVLEAAGAPFFANTPFHPVVQMLDQVVRRGSPEDRRRHLDEALARAGVSGREAAPLIAELLGLPVHDPPMLAPEQRRARLIATLADWALEAARTRPLLLVVEDLQWIDPSTIEVIQTLVDQAASAPLMLLLTARPEFRAPWVHRAHHANIALGRLRAEESRALVQAVAAASELAPDAVETVIERTDGVPLFVEELTHLMVERAGRPGSDEIPATLLDSLAARLDRLGPAKEVAQLAAVIGREFSYPLLAAVWPKSEAELRADLAALADAELIQARGAPPQAKYRFRHALIQSAAYQALLRRRRRQLHGQVAAAIEERPGAMAAPQPEVLAQHWSEAGSPEKALSAWKDAGRAASVRRALKEAESAYRHALGELARLPASPEHETRELELTSLLGRILQVTRGYAAPEAIEMADRARSLAEKAGSLKQLIREEARIWSAVTTMGDYANAAALAERIQALARNEADKPWRRLFALNAQVQMRFYTGDLAGAEGHYERLVELLDGPDGGKAASRLVVPTGVAGLAAWLLGRPEAARERMARALALAESGRNPYDLAISLHFRGALHACEDDPSSEDLARRMLALSEENGFSYAADLARAHLGWAIGRNGKAEEGAAIMRKAWASLSAARANVGAILGLTMLADLEQRAGAREKALATLDEALACNPQELAFRPETLRRRAELRLALGQQDRGEAELGEALALALRIGAQAWALRAAASLARLRGQVSGGTIGEYDRQAR